MASRTSDQQNKKVMSDASNQKPFPLEDLLPKRETQALDFITLYEKYDGRGCEPSSALLVRAGPEVPFLRMQCLACFLIQ